LSVCTEPATVFTFELPLDTVGFGVTIEDLSSTARCPEASGLSSFSDRGACSITFEVNLGVMGWSVRSARRGILDNRAGVAVFRVGVDGGDNCAARSRRRGMLVGEALIADAVIGAGVRDFGFVARSGRRGIFDG